MSTSTATIDIAGVEGGRVNLTPEQFDELNSRLEGPLLRAGDEGWDDAVLVWNGIVAMVLRSSSSRPRPTTSPRLSGSRVTACCCLASSAGATTSPEPRSQKAA